jgi:SNF2 family DNA or RNA helicase
MAATTLDLAPKSALKRTLESLDRFLELFPPEDRTPEESPAKRLAASSDEYWLLPGKSLLQDQERILDWMANKQTLHGARGGLIEAGMGAGKTLLALARAFRTFQEGRAPTLIVVPLNVMSTWAMEVEKFVRSSAARRILFWHPSFAKQQQQPCTRAELLAGQYAIVITNYETIQRSFKAKAEELKGKWHFQETRGIGVSASAWWRVATEPLEHEQAPVHAVAWSEAFFDEAQLANNTNSKTYAALMTLCVHGARWPMTGTPFRNITLDYYAQCMLAGFAEEPRRRDWTRAADVRAHFTEYEFEEHLIYKLPIADTPIKRGEIQRVVHKVVLSPEERAGYDQSERALFDVLTRQASGKTEFSAVLEAIGRLRRRTLAPILEEKQPTGADFSGPDGLGATKIRAAVEQIEALMVHGTHAKAVLFCNASQAALLLLEVAIERACPEVTTMRIDGTVKPIERAAQLRLFEDFDEGPAVLLMTGKVGGTGLNLQCATAVIILDLHWTEADQEQQVARVWRNGQVADVVEVHILVAADTIEEYVLQVTQRKKLIDAQVRARGGEQRELKEFSRKLKYYLARRHAPQTLTLY